MNTLARGRVGKSHHEHAQSSEGPQFSPLPIRASTDARMTASHWRLLSTICYHDRLSGYRATGQGCWASNRTLAQKANIHYNNVSSGIGDLIVWGYLIRSAHPTDRRRNVLRVVYEEGKAAQPSSGDEDGNKIIRAEILNSQCVQSDSRGEYITLKRNKAVSQNNIDVAVSRPAERRGKILDVIEHELANGGYLDAGTQKLVLEILSQVAFGSTDHVQAKRILANQQI